MSVALLMGSDSDWSRMEVCAKTVESFGIECDVRVLSAHRTPHEVVSYVEGAAKRGVRVFICAAGGAAHLAGVVAAHTHLPVLGVPLDNPPLGGMDALLATVQMPGGIPVATFAVGGGGPTNAALFAVRVLALGDSKLAKKLEEFGAEQTRKVGAKDERLQAARKAAGSAR